MASRTETLNDENLNALYRHHPYLLLLQKEDWQEYLKLLAHIYDVLEQQTARVSYDVIRTLAVRFYSNHDLSWIDTKIHNFFTMAIGELRVLKDSHDQLGQRYIETTREGKSLLLLIETLLAQRTKFSGTGAETLLGALNDILVSRRHLSEEEAVAHHKEKIAAYREDLVRIQRNGLAAAQLLPMEHTNEALFSQAEEAAIVILQSVEEVKDAIEQQRKDLASGYFQSRQSAGKTLSAIADFYDRLYASPQYLSYIQAKSMLSFLEGFQARFSIRNVDRILHVIETRDLLGGDLIRRSNLQSFMHQFELADAKIQEKVQAQIRILQQQVAYAVTTDVEGLRASLKAVLTTLSSHAGSAETFWKSEPLNLMVIDSFDSGAVELFDFERPVEIQSAVLLEQALDEAQERELFLALLRAEEGTLRDILARLRQYLDHHTELHAQNYEFPKGIAEYYVLAEIELFDRDIEKEEAGHADILLGSRFGQYVLRAAPAFTLRKRKDLTLHG